MCYCEYHNIFMYIQIESSAFYPELNSSSSTVSILSCPYFHIDPFGDALDRADLIKNKYGLQQIVGEDYFDNVQASMTSENMAKIWLEKV